MQRFITIDNEILMGYTGNGIKIAYMHENPIISQIHDPMPQSQSRSGRLILRMTDSLLNIIEQQYMSGLGLGRVVPPTRSFELSIVEGDTTDRTTWIVQSKWEDCVIYEEGFKPRLILNNDEFVMHLLPINFTNFTEEKRNDSWTDK